MVFHFCAVLYNKILKTENQENTSGMRRKQEAAQCKW